MILPCGKRKGRDDVSITRETVEETLDRIYEYYKNRSYNFKPLIDRPSMKQKIVRLINGILEKIGYHITRWDYIRDLEKLKTNTFTFATIYQIFKVGYGLWDNLFETLEDEESRKVLKKFIQRRIASTVLGDGKAKDIFPYEESTQHHKMSRIKFDFEIYPKEISDEIIYHTFVLKQYHPEFIDINPSDIIIDAGAFIGDTALYFSQFLENGKVYAFEPDP